MQYDTWDRIWTYAGQRICDAHPDETGEVSLEEIAQALQEELKQWDFDVKVEIHDH